MTISKSPKLSDLKHVVPAAQPAWIRIIEACKVKDAEGSASVIYEWHDLVYPVLAYAALPYATGAYLLGGEAIPDGPAWFVPLQGTHPHEEDYIAIVEHCYIAKPETGITPPQIDSKYVYNPFGWDDVLPGIWIID